MLREQLLSTRFAHRRRSKPALSARRYHRSNVTNMSSFATSLRSSQLDYFNRGEGGVAVVGWRDAVGVDFNGVDEVLVVGEGDWAVRAGEEGGGASGAAKFFRSATLIE